LIAHASHHILFVLFVAHTSICVFCGIACSALVARSCFEEGGAACGAVILTLLLPTTTHYYPQLSYRRLTEGHGSSIDGDAARRTFRPQTNHTHQVMPHRCHVKWCRRCVAHGHPSPRHFCVYSQGNTAIQDRGVTNHLEEQVAGWRLAAAFRQGGVVDIGAFGGLHRRSYSP
jgi:hypothetical protein